MMGKNKPRRVHYREPLTVKGSEPACACGKESHCAGRTADRSKVTCPECSRRLGARTTTETKGIK